jgi:hypothetical protein
MQAPPSAGKPWKDSATDNLLRDVVTVKLSEDNGFQAVVAYPAEYITTATAAKVRAIEFDRAKADIVKFWEHRASDAPAMRLKLPEPQLAAMLQAGTIQLLTGLREQNGALVLATGVIILGVYDEPSMNPVPGLPGGQVADHPSNEAAHTYSDSRLGFYPDTGPQTWGAVGILDLYDPILDDTLAFLSAGLKSAHRVPMMQHGITMLEPAYSWDIPIYFARNDKDKFLEGFYSCVVRCFHRKNLQPVEYHYRNHTYATWVTFTRSLRNMLVTESFDGGHSALEVFRAAPSH